MSAGASHGCSPSSGAHWRPVTICTFASTAIATGRHGHAFSHEGLDAVQAAEHVESAGSLDTLQEPGGPTPASSRDCIKLLAASPAPLNVVVETTTLNIRDGRPADRSCRGRHRRRLSRRDGEQGSRGVRLPSAATHRRVRRRVAFLFEGAVMDGIPIFNLVRETMPAVTVEAFRGVVNTTTNYIITMLESGEEFGPALARMQTAGRRRSGCVARCGGMGRRGEGGGARQRPARSGRHAARRETRQGSARRPARPRVPRCVPADGCGWSPRAGGMRRRRCRCRSSLPPTCSPASAAPRTRSSADGSARRGRGHAAWRRSDPDRVCAAQRSGRDPPAPASAASSAGGSNPLTTVVPITVAGTVRTPNARDRCRRRAPLRRS